MKVVPRLLSLASGLPLLLLFLLSSSTTRGTVTATIPAPPTSLSHADNPDLNGSNFTYPYPVSVHRFSSQGQDLEMAYMDVRPPQHGVHGGQSVVLLLHGKNFCAATWNATIGVLVAKGYRVVAPDQVGYCKSSKPVAYQFSLQQLALNTYTLLEHLGIPAVTVMGHSLGGMLSVRFALTFAANTTRLVLVDPIGLEDWIAAGVPYQSVDVTYAEEHASNYASIRAYEQATYYVGEWSPAYDVWVDMLVDIYRGPEGEQYAWDQALVTDMVLTQPIAYSFPLIQTPTLLFVGDKDNTAIGKAWSSPDVQAKLGHYNILGPKVCGEIPNCTLVAYPDLGHAPHLEEPTQFHADLMAWLGPGNSS